MSERRLQYQQQQQQHYISSPFLALQASSITFPAMNTCNRKEVDIDNYLLSRRGTSRRKITKGNSEMMEDDLIALKFDLDNSFWSPLTEHIIRGQNNLQSK